MAAGRTRSTRKLRAWIVEQVCSGKYPGLVWDDEAKTMFRIPWKHAGKQDFRKDEDAAIFKAWADFKGKLNDGGGDSPASWKTRLRCALNKSTEFQEVAERAQLDISEPYKVYRLVPPHEQGFVTPEKKCKAKASKRQRSRRKRTSHLDTDDSDKDEEHSRHRKLIKTEQQMTSQPVDQNFPQDAEESTASSDLPAKPEDFQCTIEFTMDDQTDSVDEITLDVRIEENVPAPTEAQDSFNVGIRYLGQEVLQRHVLGTDVRILYPSSVKAAPVPAALAGGCFPRIFLPDPPDSLPPSEEQRALSTLLPFMEHGVVLTSTTKGIYGRRFCQGRVFWTGPHTTAPGLHKMERNTEPVLLFSKDVFKQQLENFNASGGEPPQCSITLCFGEELSTTDDLASKLVIVQVTLPWAEQQVQKVVSIQDSISLLRSLASQSPLGEITLNLVPLPTDATDVCSSA